MASFTPDVAGAYTFQLTVNNGTFSSGANVTITATGGTVTNPGSASLPPIAIAGKNRNVATGKYFWLDGSASYDPGAYGLTYQWSLQSAPTGSIAALFSTDVPEPAFRPDVAGAYVFQLIVNNGAYSSPPATVTISAAGSGNIAPNANAGSALNALRGAPITVDASASYDPDSGPKPLTYSWQFTQVPAGSTLTGAPKGSGTTATFTPDVSGAYTLTLSVSDGAATSTDTVVVTASDANVTPNANAGKPRRLLPNLRVTLDGSGSNDPDKDALTYEWRLASGAPSGGTIQNATSAVANFTALAAGQIHYAARCQ